MVENADKSIEFLSKQIQTMLSHKQNKSKPYPIPENISQKSKEALRDMEANHDHGLCVEFFLRNEKNMDKVALLYRGNKITYHEMFENIFAFARSMSAMGIGKDDEVPVLVSNMPEYVYVFLALNLIGAKMNTVGAWFHPEYLKEIFTHSKCRYLFASDDCFAAAQKSAEQADCIKKIVMFSVTDSLPVDDSGNKYNPYQEIDDRYNDFHNKIDEWRNTTCKEIITLAEFLSLGKDYADSVVADSILDDVAAITYTSGTTKPGYPKGCIHSNRNYIAISRFKVSDVSGMPPMKDMTVLALLPSYTQTVLTTAYCDPLCLGCTTALEPFYSEEFFIHTININKPNHLVNTPGFFMNFAKKISTEADWLNVKMPYFLLPTVVGEAFSLGEERFMNKVAKAHKFGADKLPLKISAPFSIGGGSTENGGVLITLFCAWQKFKPKYWLHKERPQLQTLPLAEIEVLDENGYPCECGKQGRLVINSACNQIGYVNDEFNKGMHITDANGKQWYSGGAYAVKYKSGDIRIVGRPNTNISTSDGQCTPLYKIEDVVNSDYKNIMSAVMVKINVDDEAKYVCHIEKQPDTKMTDDVIIRRCRKRLSKSVHREILDNMYLKIRDSFPLAPSGKRDIAALTAEGVDGVRGF